MSIVGSKCDLYAPFVQLCWQAIDGVKSLVRLGVFIDWADNYRDMETGNVIEYGLRMADVVQSELQTEFMRQSDRGLQIVGLLGPQDNLLLALQVG